MYTFTPFVWTVMSTSIRVNKCNQWHSQGTYWCISWETTSTWKVTTLYSYLENVSRNLEWSICMEHVIDEVPDPRIPKQEQVNTISVTLTCNKCVQSCSSRSPDLLYPHSLAMHVHQVVKQYIITPVRLQATRFCWSTCNLGYRPPSLLVHL